MYSLRPGLHKTGRPSVTEHAPQKLLDFFYKDLFQIFETAQFLFGHGISRDREAL